MKNEYNLKVELLKSVSCCKRTPSPDICNYCVGFPSRKIADLITPTLFYHAICIYGIVIVHVSNNS